MLAMYEHATGDIERAKQWGWQLTYTAIGSQFGVVALATVYSGAVWTSLLFYVTVLAIAIYATVLIGYSQKSLTIFRDRLTLCKGRLSANARAIVQHESEKRPWPLAVAVWFSFTITELLLFARTVAQCTPGPGVNP